MIRIATALFLAILALSAALTDAHRKPSPRTDLYGDPLPAGAVARLGTVRFRRPGFVNNAEFSPNGRYVATFGNRVLLWDFATGKVVREFVNRDASPFCSGKTFAPDGQRIYAIFPGETQCDSAEILCWNVSTGKLLFRTDASVVPAGFPRSLAVSPDGKFLAVGSEDDTIHLFDAKTGDKGPEIVANFVEGNSESTLAAFAFHRDGRHLVVIDGDRLRVLEAATGKEKRRLEFKDAKAITSASAVALSPDGRFIACLNPDLGLQLIDTVTERVRRLTIKNIDDRTRISIAQDGRTLIIFNNDSDDIRLLDADTGRQVRQVRLPGLSKVVDRLVLSPDGKCIVGACDEGQPHTLWRWWLEPGHRPADTFAHTTPPDAIAFSDDGKHIVSMSGTDEICCWNVLSSRSTSLARLTSSNHAKHWILGPGAASGAMIDGNHEVRSFDTRTGKVLQTVFRDPDRIPERLAFSAKGDFLAVLSGKSIHIRDIKSRKEYAVIDTESKEQSIDWIQFSPDGHTLLTGDGPRTIHLWELPGGKYLRRIGDAGPANEDAPTPANFCPSTISFDGRTLFVLYTDGLVVWDLEHQRQADPFEHAVVSDSARRIPLLGGEYSPLLALTPDGRFLVSVNESDKPVIYETASGQIIHTFDSPTCAVAFSRDGRLLATASEFDCSVLLWDFGESILRSGDSRPSATIHDLASSDARAAVRAVFQLSHDEESAIALLGAGLRPVRRADAATVAAYISKLESPGFSERVQATEQLRALAATVAPELKAACANGTPETRRRARQLLDCIEKISSENLLAVRGVQVLENLATDGSRSLLREYAGGAPEARLTREAKAALARLDAKH